MKKIIAFCFKIWQYIFDLILNFYLNLLLNIDIAKLNFCNDSKNNNKIKKCCKFFFTFDWLYCILLAKLLIFI